MKNIALLTAAAAAVVMVGGAALAQNAVNPTGTGPSKTHAGNPDPTSGGGTHEPQRPRHGQAEQSRSGWPG